MRNKKLKIFFSMLTLVFVVSPILVLAQVPADDSGGVPASPQANGGATVGQYKYLEPDVIGGHPDSFESYMRAFFDTLLAITVILSILMMVVGGVMYIVSEAINKKDAGKDYMKNALLGLLLALTAYLILVSINPKLVGLDGGWNLSGKLQKTPGGTPGASTILPGGNLPTSNGPIDQVLASLCQKNQSTAAMAYTAASEGWINNSYFDSLGNPTIGIGHKIVAGDNFPATGIDDAKARELFIQDYAKAQGNARDLSLTKGVDYDSLSPARQAVLTDMAFNMGTGNDGLGGFNKMFAAMKEKNYTGASAEVMNSKYSSQVGNRAGNSAKIMKDDNANFLSEYASTNKRTATICSS